MPRTDPPQPRYQANLTKAALKVSESRIVAGILLDEVGKEEWNRLILVENVLQKRSPVAAKTIADYLAQRLRLSHPSLWLLIRDGSTSTATQATLAATIKHSALLGDFLDLVVREELRQFKSHLPKTIWTDYMEGCIARDANAANWTPPVIQKLRQNIFHILAEAGYLSNTKSLQLQRLTIQPQILNHLEEQQEHYVLRCINVAA